MKRQLLTLGLGVLMGVAGLFSTPAHAESQFYSGRVDVNPALGGTITVGVKEFSGFSGFNYSNLDQATNTVTVLGFAQFSTSRAGLLQGTPANPSQRLVAVYALQGQFTGNLITGNLSADFNNGLVAMRVYDFGLSPVINPLDPGTWVPNIGNLNQGVVATFGLGKRPDALLQGPPGGIFTDPMATFDPAKVNTARTTLNEIARSATADVKFHYLGGGDGGTMLDYTPPGYILNQEEPTLLVSLTQRLAATESAAWNALGNLPDTLIVYNGLLGTSVVKPGDVLTPSTFGANGDVILATNGGTAIPGSQVPEPTALASTLVGSGLLSSISLLYRRIRRRI